MDPSTDNGTMADSGSRHSPEIPSPCARGCGFFGSPENRGFCSKCYTGYLKETMTKSTKTSNQQISKINSINVPTVCAAAPPKRRCGLCNKKVGLLGFECRCGGSFCGIHRYPETHPCKFDFKAAGKIIIEKENPICKADKITDRV